jgi:5'-phosphate synthase pdxT subunit
MDYNVTRNAFGGQRESFEMPLIIEGIAAENEPFPGVFIRAPLILEVYNECTPISFMPDGTGIIAARQNNLLGLVFHPELTNDLRVHKYFIKMIQ